MNRCYRPQPFPSDHHRVEYLFALHEQLTTPLGVFGVVASAKREVGAPRSRGVVVVVHSATGGVADTTLSELGS